MARFVVPVVVLVALVGGFVVGQQPDRADPQPPNVIGQPVVNGWLYISGATQLPAKSEADVHFTTVELRTGPVGRYVPADGGRMLDTTNGTLYAVSGTQWQVVASLLGVSGDEMTDQIRRQKAREGVETLYPIEKGEFNIEQKPVFPGTKP